MVRPKRFWWLVAGAASVVICIFARPLISAVYVNAAAVVLAQATPQSSCALGLSRMALEGGRRERAQALLEHAVAWNTDNKRAWRLLGDMALAEGDVARATAALGQANDRTSQLWLLWAATDQGQNTQTWQVADAEPFLLALGDCFVMEQNVEQARQSYRIARDDLGSMSAYLRLGDLEAAHGHMDQAKRSYQYVVEHTGDHEMRAGAHLGLGKIFVRHGAFHKAQTHFETAFALDTSASMASRIGMAYRGSFQYVPSDRWFLKWAELTPASPDPYRVLGLNALDDGRLHAARRFLERSEKAGGNSTDLYYGLGKIYNVFGDTAKARQAFERVLAIDANHVKAREQLQLLGGNDDA